MVEFNWPIRIYYEDTDSGGVVYHSSYLNFMERARTEYLRSLKIEQDELIQQQAVLFAVRKIEIDYIMAARFNDLLTVATTVTKIAGASIVFSQVITKADDSDVIICKASVKVASLQVDSFKPCAIPEKLKMKLRI
ncbi:Tol-Pal system-associated acyl-CoA thioesterase [hydrothermal vent metagenome]|uniref:Tol-Pal system-associated acyl-CoA thioesterase n=1 Tax=hydrothermal vent metagenome TaxID=652676 RepID=A0A3B1AD54_9ZZZZ